MGVLSLSGRFDEIGADGAPRRLGIMGGTFDPVHMGHLAIAEQARAALGLDAVVFMVACDPVFKRDVEVAPAEDRLAMCRLAVADNVRFDASALEIERGGATYTVDTLRALRALLPDNVELWFIAGSDAALTIDLWRESDEIARLAHLAVPVRPDHPVPDEAKRALAQAGFDAAFLDVTRLDVSSTDVRARLEAGATVRYLVPDAVLAYIRDHGLYRPAGRSAADGGEDVFSKEFLERLQDELSRRVKPKRLRHIMGVAKTARRLAGAYGQDADRAFLAGLLHDWDKGFDDASIRARALEAGADVDPFTFDHMPQVLHGPTAAAALAREHPSIPEDVLLAVKRHTAGAPDMEPLDMIVYTADAIEPSRDYPGVEDLRAEVGKEPLEQLFFDTLRRTVANLVDCSRTVHPVTAEVWNAYALRARERAGEGKAKGHEKRKGSK